MDIQQLLKAHGKTTLDDPENKKFEMKLNKVIGDMPEEVRDRFKALRVIQDENNQLDEEDEENQRQLDLKYDEQYKPTYDLRSKILTGALEEIPQDLIDEYDKRAEELNDEEYKNLDVEICDVKAMQNSPSGVPGFWLKVLLNANHTKDLVFEKDRAILQSLIDMKYVLHKEGYGFDLIFVFESNTYFKNTELKKSYHQLKQNIIEKCEGTEIQWNDGCDVTIKKVKKKQKNKKSGANRTITKSVKQDSFFNFFKTISADDDEKEDKEGSGDEEDIGNQMDEDFDVGQKIKDEVIPLALEFYMDVIDQDDEEDEEGDDNEDDDDDEDDKPKKPKKEAKGPKKDGEQNKEDCKQQ